jgi:hypothetical protein
MDVSMQHYDNVLKQMKDLNLQLDLLAKKLELLRASSHLVKTELLKTQPKLTLLK